MAKSRILDHFLRNICNYFRDTYTNPIIPLFRAALTTISTVNVCNFSTSMSSLIKSRSHPDCTIDINRFWSWNDKWNIEVKTFWEQNDWCNTFIWLLLFCDYLCWFWASQIKLFGIIPCITIVTGCQTLNCVWLQLIHVILWTKHVLCHVVPTHTAKNEWQLN